MNNYLNNLGLKTDAINKKNIFHQHKQKCINKEWNFDLKNTFSLLEF